MRRRYIGVRVRCFGNTRGLPSDRLDNNDAEITAKEAVKGISAAGAPTGFENHFYEGGQYDVFS